MLGRDGNGSLSPSSQQTGSMSIVGTMTLCGILLTSAVKSLGNACHFQVAWSDKVKRRIAQNHEAAPP